MIKDKKMVHAVMVKWRCSVCGGFESDTGKYSYGEEPQEPREESKFKVEDITGKQRTIHLCPRCVYKGALILARTVALDEQGYGPIFTQKPKPRKKWRWPWQKKK